MLGAAHAIDELLDVDKADLQQEMVALFDGRPVRTFTTTLQQRCIEYVDSLSQERRNGVMDSLQKAGVLVRAIAQTVTVEELINLRLQEANLFANIMALQCENRQDAPQRRAFNSWLHCSLRCGYLVDSIVDMTPDYRNQESGVRPTVRARGALVKAAVPEAVTMIRSTPVRALGKAALVGFRHQVLKKKPTF